MQWLPVARMALPREKMSEAQEEGGTRGNATLRSLVSSTQSRKLKNTSRDLVSATVSFVPDDGVAYRRPPPRRRRLLASDDSSSAAYGTIDAFGTRPTRHPPPYMSSPGLGQTAARQLPGAFSSRPLRLRRSFPSDTRPADGPSRRRPPPAPPALSRARRANVSRKTRKDPSPVTRNTRSEGGAARRRGDESKAMPLAEEGGREIAPDHGVREPGRRRLRRKSIVGALFRARRRRRRLCRRGHRRHRPPTAARMTLMLFLRPSLNRGRVRATASRAGTSRARTSRARTLLERGVLEQGVLEREGKDTSGEDASGRTPLGILERGFHG